MKKRSFRDALLAAMELQSLPLSKIAERSGVSYEQLKKFKQNPDRSIRVEDAMAIAQNAFGTTVDQFLTGRSAPTLAELSELWRELPDSDRQRLLEIGRVLRSCTAKSPSEDAD